MENILLLSKEVLRKDYLGCYGSKHFKTPNIDRLAERGTIFTNYYTAAPSTAMAITCMFSGLNAYELDRHSYTEVEQFTQAPTLFSILEEKGYETHVIWSAGNWDMTWRFSKVFAPNTKIHDLPGVATHIYALDRAQKGITSIKDTPQDDLTMTRYYQTMVEVIRGAKKPIFVWMHCPHIFNPRDSIGSDIDLLDELVGKIMNYLDGSIYLTADHGGMIGEKDAFGYGFHVYEGVANIPLITPNYFGKNTIDEPTSSIQLKNIILEKKIYHQEYVYSDTQYYEQPDRKLMIRKGDFKYIYNKRNKSEELYDLSYDPEETVNLLMKEWYEPNRRITYFLKDVYYYPRWDESETTYLELRREKDRIWRTGNLPMTSFLAFRRKVGKYVPLFVIKMMARSRFGRKLLR